MNNGNFKVECIDGVGGGSFTINEIYTLVDGIITYDNGTTCEKTFDSVVDLNNWMVSKFKLIEDKTTEDKLQKIYQEIRDIFGDKANVMLNVYGNNATATIRYLN